MITVMGFLTIIVLLVLIVTKKASVHFCLVILPIIAALICGFGMKEIGGFMSTGMTKIAPTAIMLTFAVLFFGIMYDAGLFDPAIRGVIRLAGGDPLKIAIGTCLIAILAHLDGSGASTYLVTITAMLPVYTAMNMSVYTLATITALSAGTMNILPWGGPTMRAAAVLEMDVSELFRPMIPVMLTGLVMVLAVSAYLGYRERKRVGIKHDLQLQLHGNEAEAESIKRPKLLLVNVLLTVAAIVTLVLSLLPMATVFVIAVPLALIINYPNPAMQKERIEAQAKTAIYTASIIFCAGVFTGVLSETGMIEAMAMAIASLVPASLGHLMPPVLAIFSVPMSIFFDPDSMYYGVMPVLATAAEALGVSSVSVARAFLLGGHTTAFPLSPVTGSTWVLLSLTGINLGLHQKKTIIWTLLVTAAMTVVALLIGLI